MSVKISGTVRSGSEYISVEADSIEEYLVTVSRLQGSPTTNKSKWSCPVHGTRAVRYREDKNYFYCSVPLVQDPEKGAISDWCGHTSFSKGDTE